MLNVHSVLEELEQKYDYVDNILEGIINLLIHYSNRHGKTLVVRFDVSFPEVYCGDVGNSAIVSCVAKVVQKYKRDGLDPFYMWVRERRTSANPHYHCVLLLNGNKVWSYSHVFSVVERLWGSTIGFDAGGLIDHCTKSKCGVFHENGILLIRAANNFQERFNDVVRQVTYMAKSSGKYEYNDGLRNFGMSRIW